MNPVVNFINVKCTNFYMNVCFGSFYYVHVTRKSCWNDVRTKNARILRWWSWRLVIPNKLGQSRVACFNRVRLDKFTITKFDFQSKNKGLNWNAISEFETNPVFVTIFLIVTGFCPTAKRVFAKSLLRVVWLLVVLFCNTNYLSMTSHPSMTSYPSMTSQSLCFKKS